MCFDKGVQTYMKREFNEDIILDGTNQVIAYNEMVLKDYFDLFDDEFADDKIDTKKIKNREIDLTITADFKNKKLIYKFDDVYIKDLKEDDNLFYLDYEYLISLVDYEDIKKYLLKKGCIK